MNILIITVAVIAVLTLIILIKLWSISSDIEQINEHIDEIDRSLGRLSITIRFNEKIKHSDEFIKKIIDVQHKASLLGLNWFNDRHERSIEEYIININKLLKSCANMIVENEIDNNETADAK